MFQEVSGSESEYVNSFDENDSHDDGDDADDDGDDDQNWNVYCHVYV